MQNTQEKDSVLSDILADVNVVKNASTGSDAFTFLCVKNNQMLYRKIALKQFGGVDKLKMQLDWLVAHQKHLPLTKIGNYFYDGEVCWYDMFANAVSESLASFIEKNPVEQSWKILNNALESIKPLYKINDRPSNPLSIENYINSKIFGNAQTIATDGGEYLKKLQNYSTLNINGKPYKNLDYYFGTNGVLSKALFKSTFKNDRCSDIHGDLTLENIICDSKADGGFYYIDPNLGQPHESSLLDYSKLLQSLHGNYEHLQKVNDVEIDGSSISFDCQETPAHKEIYKLYDQYLKNNFSVEDYKSIYFHEIVHWLRLMPYKIRLNPHRAVIYYGQMLVLLDELVKRFEV